MSHLCAFCWLATKISFLLGLDGTDNPVQRSIGPSSSALAVAKDLGLVTWRFTQTLLRRLPDVADENPVKVALGIAKLILEIKDVGYLSLRKHLIDQKSRA